MSFYIPNKLLTDNNAKTKKGEKIGWKTFILYLAPFTQNSKGINLCPHASEGCAKACLFGSGHGSMSTVEKGRMNKTEMYLKDRGLFFDMLIKEITKHSKKYEKLAIRLNGTSDIRFEKLKHNGKTIFEHFPNIQFYDYTKNPFRFKTALPANYHLTFSRSEENHEIAMELLSKGVNVAIVFDKVPTEFNGYTVINGDENDLRFKDDKGVIVGLKYKKLTGKGADNETAFKTGFAVKTADILEMKKTA
jgi:hypothetical protein